MRIAINGHKGRGGSIGDRAGQMLLVLRDPKGKLIDRVDVPSTATLADLKEEIEHSSKSRTMAHYLYL